MLTTLLLTAALAEAPLRPAIDPRFLPQPAAPVLSAPQSSSAVLQPDPITHPF